MEQLSSFMGHELDIHLEYYRLPCDIIQVAKVLLAIEEGLPVKVRGATLDDLSLEGKKKVLI